MNGLSRTYQTATGVVRALDRVSMTVVSGEIVGLKGRSGSGKSTLLNIVGLLDKPTSGDLALFGAEPPQGVRERSLLRRERIGFLFQDAGLVERMSALDNVKLPLRMTSMSGPELDKLCKSALGEVGLAARSGHPPSALSGGERQRVGVARIIAQRPRLIVCDEPTAGLDAETSHVVMKQIVKLVDSGSGAIIANHDPIVDKYCSRKIFLEAGRLKI